MVGMSTLLQWLKSASIEGGRGGVCHSLPTSPKPVRINFWWCNLYLSPQSLACILCELLAPPIKGRLWKYYGGCGAGVRWRLLRGAQDSSFVRRGMPRFCQFSGEEGRFYQFSEEGGRFCQIVITQKTDKAQIRPWNTYMGYLKKVM